MAESDTDSSFQECVDRFRTLLIAGSLSSLNKLCSKLQGLATNIEWSLDGATALFDALQTRFESKTADRSHPLSWMLNMLHCIEMHHITPSWRSQTGKTLIQLVRDETVTDEGLTECLADNAEKPLDEILDEIRQQKLNHINNTLLDDVKDIVSSVDEDHTLHNGGSQRSGLKQVLRKLCQAVEQSKSYRPRLTQMVSWCIMALSKTGRLIQVGTGEGKSCIVAMFAASRAMTGQQVDIFTSSLVLAERDMEEWRGFYNVLKISVNCNTNKQDKDLRECYKCQVVYGTAHEFAGHWLNQRFKRMDIFGKRTFQCAIVDEVDSLMLDKGSQFVYISNDMPALEHLNALMAFIWNTAEQYIHVDTETALGPKIPSHQVVLENITKGNAVDEFTILQIAEDKGLLAKGSVKELRKNPHLLTEKTENVTANQLAKFFETVERSFPSCQFALHCINNDGSIEKLNKIPQKETAERQRAPLLLVNGGFCQYMYFDTESKLRAAEAEVKRAVHFTPCELSEDKMTCYVPGFLSDLVNSTLKVWIKNAFKAQTMTKDKEYIIERHGVVPVDYSSTGVVENFTIMSDGLQQFLEMKHNCKLSDMTAITNYMSNMGLYLKYKDQIFGISGTLGQQAETDTLEKIYKGIKTLQIPLFKRRKLFEVEGVIVADEKGWIEKICNVVFAKTNPTTYRARRAVLIICQTIHQANVLHHALGGKVPKKKLYISNNMDNLEVFKMIQAGDVIVATNLAGRGTDLKVSENVNTAGGLFVLQTFLPENARVEAQAFGRTARQGSPGSAQLIVCSSHLSEQIKLMAFVMLLRSYQNSLPSHRQSNDMSSTLLSHILTENSDSVIKIVKKVRDDLVAKTLARYVECDIPAIKKKEDLFSQYLDTLDEVYKSSNNEPADSDVSALNEFWGIWLLKDFNENESVSDLENKLTEALRTARQKLTQRESPSSNLHHYTAFGNDLRKKGHLAESIKMYTRAIQEDRCWAAIAYYNRALTSLSRRDTQQDPNCIHQALEDLQNALKSVDLYCEQIEVTRRYSMKVKDLPSDSFTRFDRHMTTRHQVLLCFKENINKNIQKVDRARELGGNVKVKEILVYFLFPLDHVLPFANLLIESLTTLRTRDPLKLLQFITHPHFDSHNELTRLKNMGLTHVYTLDTLIPRRGFLSNIQRFINEAFK